MACAPSPALSEELDWSEIPDCIAHGPLAGEITATNMVLTPPRGLDQHELQLSVDDVSDFTFSWVKEQDESLRLEIRFVVRSGQKGAAGLIENFLRNVGTSACELRFDVSEQQELELGEGTALENADDTTKGNTEIFGGKHNDQFDEKTGTHARPELVARDDKGEVVRKFDSAEEMETAGVELPTAREAAGGTPHLRGRRPGGLARAEVQ
jgi:hypothetical protein